jgi:DNA helicase HerA-like ATPase
MIDLTGKSFAILGLKGTGKSTQADSILNLYGKSALYYDTLWESPENAPYVAYTPTDKYSVAELEALIEKITPKKEGDIPVFRAVIIDEANRFCPPKPKPLPPKIANLNDIGRHYLMAVGYIARRPVQLNQDLIELCDYLFIYRLTGKNDLQYLNNTVTGLGDVVAALGKYEFVLVNPDKSYAVCNPIKTNENWLNNAKRLIEK